MVANLLTKAGKEKIRFTDNVLPYSGTIPTEDRLTSGKKDLQKPPEKR